MCIRDSHKTAEGAIVYNTAVAYPVGILFAIAMLALFLLSLIHI